MTGKEAIPKLLESASDVWMFLKEEGGLDPDPNKYDADLVEELRNRLSLPSGDFEELLSNKSVSTEKFVIAFFQTVEPYAAMMSDLLSMFEQVGAKQTNENIAISFNFEQNFPELNFDLSHFRSCLETWRKIADTYLTPRWENETIWNLNRVLSPIKNVTISDSNVKEWLSQYYGNDVKDGVWPDFPLPSPTSGDNHLDQLLAQTWIVWTEVVKESSQYGRERGILKKIAFEQRHKQDKLSVANQVTSQPEGGGWPPTLLGDIDLNNWAGSLAKNAYYQAERISMLSYPEKSIEAEKLQKKLEEVFKQVPKVEVEGETLVRVLQDFLQLPIWKHRYELYSVWILTQIWEVLKDYSLRVHQVDGKLKFSFSGTHFATADAFDPRLHILTELRSPLANPIGKSRKKSIQPDYSLITDPFKNPEASILEVECKQYRKPSKTNFSQALIDYARGRPKAHIVLVNYSDVNEKIRDKIQDKVDAIDSSISHRIHLIGNMRPGLGEAQQARERFKQQVQDALDRRYGSINTTVPTYNNSVKLNRVLLEWQEMPRDISLHIEIRADGKIHNISYYQIGSPTEDPGVTPLEDKHSGYGLQTIEITNPLKGKHHFYVNNFFSNFPLAGCGATLALTFEKQKYFFQCPTDGQGNYWSIAVIDTSTKQVERINKIVDFPWL